MSTVQSTPQGLYPQKDGYALNHVELNHLVVELTGLLETAATPEDFFTPYLEKILEATGASGVALWQRHAGGHLVLLHEFNFGSLNLDQVKNGTECHALLLEEASLTRRATWVPPTVAKDAPELFKANVSPFALLLVPIVVEDKAVGLLELFLAPEQERQEKRALIRLATELVGFAAAFMHKRQWKALKEEQQVWQELEAFAAEVHKTLDPREVACLVANDAKRLVKCDQLSVATCSPGLANVARSCEILAISGSVTLERHSPLVKAMNALLASVCTWGEVLTYEGKRDESLPAKVLEALDAYLAQSNSRLLIALPLHDQHEGTSAQISGILLAESFGGNPQTEQIQQRLNHIARHAGPALSNALALDRLPLQWLTRPLANLKTGLNTSSRLRLLTFAGVLVLLSAFLAFCPLPLKSEANGQLVPMERRVVYAPLNGKIVHLASQHGDRVGRGQELLFIEDLDTQLKIDQLSVKIGSFNQMLSLIEEHLNKPLSAKERADYLNDRIRTQYDLGKAKVERNLLLSENRNPRKAAIIAPVAGQVLTFDAREKLLGKTVKVGDPLLRLGCTSGTWEVELYIPEREVGQVREAIYRSGEKELEVDLLMTSEPTRIYHGKIGLDSLGGETTVHNDKIVLPARVTITDPGLLTQLEHMPVGVEVRARIHCGRASAGYVWFNEIWNFLYEKFVF